MKYLILFALIACTVQGIAQPAKPLAIPLVNQAGYNRGEAKRFVCYEAADGTPFQVIRQSDKAVR